MTVNIFMYHFGIKIVPGNIFVQYSPYVKDKNSERIQAALKEFIPKTCGKINLYCDNSELITHVIDIVSYAHSIGAALTINTYDITELKSINDWDKINNNIKYNVNIVF